MKHLATKHLAILVILLSTMLFSYAYAVDVSNETFISQSSSSVGSNNSVISTEYYERPSQEGAYYINKGNNSSVIGNYFEGYYYDSVYGYFEFDWSSNSNENVRIVGSTSICPNSYGYKLGGYSYSPSHGYVDFDYNEEIFVYYCEENGYLSGYAYSDFIGYQNFEGIEFNIDVSSDIIADEVDENDSFVNSIVEINDGEIRSSNGNSGIASELGNESEKINSNFSSNTIQNDVFEFNVNVESLFYIIK